MCRAGVVVMSHTARHNIDRKCIINSIDCSQYSGRHDLERYGKYSINAMVSSCECA